MELSQTRTKAIELMQQHGLSNWRFEFDPARRRFGICRYGRKVIGLSRYLVALNDEAEVTNTILHEIAHALVGPENHGHGYVWKAKAREIGCDGQRCYDSNMVVRPRGAYTGTCPKCGKTHERSRASVRPAACGQCCRMYNHNRYSEEFRLVFIRNR